MCDCENCGEEVEKVLCPRCAREEPEDVVDFFNRNGNKKLRKENRNDGLGKRGKLED